MNPTNYPTTPKFPTPSPQIPTPALKLVREDMRHGDPHGNKTGDHPFYGPDLCSLEIEEKKKPMMESHGFYVAKENSPPPPQKTRAGVWARIKQFFRPAA